MSHADTSFASVYPTIFPWLPRISASSGSGAVNLESTRMPIACPGTTHTRAVLGVAKAGAHLVGAAASPHFGRVDRQQRLGRLGMAAGQRRRQFLQRDRLGVRPPDQVANRVIGDGPRRFPFKDGCGDRGSKSNLSQAHEIVL